MDDIKRMFRTIVNGQSAVKQELLSEIKKVDNRVGSLDSKLDKLGIEMNKGFNKVNNRLDKIGKSVAFLEDDAPTRDEHDKLEKRVTKVEKKLHLQSPA